MYQEANVPCDTNDGDCIVHSKRSWPIKFPLTTQEILAVKPELAPRCLLTDAWV